MSKSNLLASRSSKKLAYLILAIALTTWVHHIYGGLAYDTLYRIIAPSISIPLLLVATFYLQYRVIRKPMRLVKILYAFVVSVFWILSIGIVEGGYNHVIKNFLFFSGISKEKLATFFPPEFGSQRFFEMPSDVFFEVTGIIQFFIGLGIIYYLWKFLKKSN